MIDIYEKQLKWLEVASAYDAYKQACANADISEHLRRKIRDDVYALISAGTATAEDILRLPATHEDSFPIEVSLGLHFDHLLCEYHKLG
jgi:hypothetical protein